MKEVNDFFDQLKEIKEVKAILTENLSYWGEDIPVTILFSDLGRAIVSRPNKFKENEVEKILFSVEKVMQEGSDLMKSCVATGFLESLSNEARAQGVWDRLFRLLGKESSSYIKKIDEFQID